MWICWRIQEVNWFGCWVAVYASADVQTSSLLWFCRTAKSKLCKVLFELHSCQLYCNSTKCCYKLLSLTMVNKYYLIIYFNICSYWKVLEMMLKYIIYVIYIYLMFEICLQYKSYWKYCKQLQADIYGILVKVSTWGFLNHLVIVFFFSFPLFLNALMF